MRITLEIRSSFLVFLILEILEISKIFYFLSKVNGSSKVIDLSLPEDREINSTKDSFSLNLKLKVL